MPDTCQDTSISGFPPAILNLFPETFAATCRPGAAALCDISAYAQVSHQSEIITHHPGIFGRNAHAWNVVCSLRQIEDTSFCESWRVVIEDWPLRTRAPEDRLQVQICLPPRCHIHDL